MHQQKDQPPFFKPGEWIAGRFHVQELLGAGGTSVVYRVDDRLTGRPAALKILLRRINGDRCSPSRFLRGARLARRILHPNVHRIYEVLRLEDAPMIAMEVLEGESLEAHLKNRGPMSPERTLAIVRQVAAGLAAAHRHGIVHRDLKAANVILVPGLGQERAVIVDFGLAKIDPLCRAAHAGPADKLTQTGAWIGTPAYMAPEQLLGEEVTWATDIHALGLLTYEMLTGELPFVGGRGYAAALRRLSGELRPPSDLAPGLDPRWEEAILRCLALEPEKRFASVFSFVMALAASQDEPQGLRRLWAFVHRSIRPGLASAG